MACSPPVVAKIGMSCSRRADSACPQDACAASVLIRTRATKRAEYPFLRNPREFELCNVLLSSFGYAWFLTNLRGCRRIHSHQRLFKVLDIVAESCLVSIGDADKFKAEDRPC